MLQAVKIFRSITVGLAIYWAASLAALALYLPQAIGDAGFLTAPFTFLLVGAAAAPTPPTIWFVLLPAIGLVFLAASIFVRRAGWAVAALGLAAFGARCAVPFLTGYS